MSKLGIKSTPQLFDLIFYLDIYLNYFVPSARSQADSPRVSPCSINPSRVTVPMRRQILKTWHPGSSQPWHCHRIVQVQNTLVALLEPSMGR